MLTLSPQLLEKTRQIAEQAGKYLTAFYHDVGQNLLDVQTKLDDTPVTAADLFLSQFLIEQLTALTPDVPILSEENCKIPFEMRSQWQEYWLIDPLDGTQQFINRTDHFAVLITLVQDTRPVLGIIHAPMLNTTYYGMQGVGAYKKVGSEIKPLAAQLAPHDRVIKIGVGSLGAQQKVRSILNPHYQYEFLIYGSCGLKSGLVADGTCDCYIRFGSTGEWDTAPAEALLAEIGGQVFDFDFQPLTYNQKAHFTNPNFVMVANSTFDWHKIFQFST
ncbi:MAG: 3'(2'),5'-bisphosphate nucleotidase CysQ [Pasteurella oralis]|uniref:3'(2'),5'-bisphosphate nucleotidase CysQ n=1 Tax=Pasteurella oralis TaxID=1071947 RepID=UPI00270AA5EF|nr:3'(2'),5'-bisphosphate nucleotidase CysQ [Pasteurella oralis]